MTREESAGRLWTAQIVARTVGSELSSWYSQVSPYSGLFIAL
jgi:hypothetical protein